jgi:hypothetical protein
MCCSAWAAVFSKTITGTCEVVLDGIINQVIWYQSRVGGTGRAADDGEPYGNRLLRRNSL